MQPNFQHAFEPSEHTVHNLHDIGNIPLQATKPIAQSTRTVLNNAVNTGVTIPSRPAATIKATASTPSATATDLAKKVYDLTWQEADEIATPDPFPPITGKTHVYPVKSLAYADIRPIQKWEGTVVEINDKTFSARLRDLTLSDAEPAEEADFTFAEVNEADWPLISIGAMFYWVISLKTEHGTGQPLTETTVYFKRQVKLTKSRAKKITREAQKLHELFNTPIE